ncbi:MAG TPA: TDT family transporter [Acidocella sp.]|nr:TDT family transporter [Acidocella sp.]
MFTIPRPFTHHDHPLEIIRQFTPNWFTVTMGTGVLALALNLFPLGQPYVRETAALIWRVNMVLFALCTVLYAARWVIFPREAALILSHPVMPMFLGAIPMGLVTIINGFIVFGLPRYGQAAIDIAQTLWWIDAAMSLAVGLLVPYLMFTRQSHSMESMTAVWLLPIVASEVAAASGGLLAPHLANPAAVQMVFFSYMLWALSVPLALGVLVILFLRLALHKLPRRDMAVSSWLALGPLGTGALGLLVLGHDAPGILGAAGMPAIATAAQGIGLIGGLVLWAYGAWWLLMAAGITLTYLKEGLPFNMGWWGFTFPLGVFTLATYALAPQTGMGLFTVLGAVFTVALAGFWLMVSARTLLGGYKGHLFVSPCLSGKPALSQESGMLVNQGWPS